MPVKMMSVRALFVVGRNRGVADRDDKRARKARTAVVRGVGRAAFDVHVVTAVTAIPLKSVLLVVLNGEIRAILQVGLIVVAEIDGMNVADDGAIHGKRSVIERERGILACAHRHPIPHGGNICEIKTTRIAGGLLLGYNPWMPASASRRRPSLRSGPIAL